MPHKRFGGEALVPHVIFYDENFTANMTSNGFGLISLAFDNRTHSCLLSGKITCRGMDSMNLMPGTQRFVMTIEINNYGES